MAKKSNHRTVVFLSDYATKKAGEEFRCDGMLARTLIDEGVAELKEEATEQEPNIHTITEEDLTNNPELAGQVEVGEDVELGPIVPAEEVTQFSEEVFEPLPEVTEENSGEEKVSAPVKKNKKSSSKPKGN